MAAWGDDEIKGSELSALQCHVLTGRSGACHYSCRKNINPLMEDTHLCLPLKDKVETFGLLQLHGVSRIDDPHLQSLLQSLIEHSSMALSNMRLREGLMDLSIRDPLTGLFNRRYLDNALQDAERMARADESSIGVVIFDLDYFKRINDSYGHDAGDVALKTFAKILLGHVRTGDTACRSGGEEFVLVLPGASAGLSLKRADEIRSAMAQKPVLYGASTLGLITVSAGIAAFPESGATSSDVLRAADWALYQAKGQGRNRCVVAQPELMPKPH